ncbi:MAG: zinc ribbon domain-containing protein [Promethearchaeota archaeon]
MNGSSTRSKFARLFFSVIVILIYLVVNFDLLYSSSLIVFLGITVFLAVFAIILPRLKSSSREAVIPEPTESPRSREDLPRETEPRSSEGIQSFDVVCPDCGYENPSDAQFCIGCGRRLP